MSNLLKAEFHKLKRSKMLCLSIFLGFMEFVLIYVTLGDLRGEAGRATFIYIFNLQSSVGLILLMGIFISDFVVKEFTSGYIKNLISYGYRRIEIFISKSAACFVGTLFITFVPPIVIGVINTILNGYGEKFDFNSVFFIIRTFFLILIIQVAIASIEIFIAFISRNINVTVIIIVAMDFFNRILNFVAFQKYSFISFYDKYISDKNILNLTECIISDKVTEIQIFQSIFVAVLTLAFFMAIGNYAFKNLDIK